MQQTKATDIPGIFLPHVESYVSDCGGDVEALFRAAGIDPDTFRPELDYISEDQFYGFIKEAENQSNQISFGLGIGSRLTLSSFGLLSRAFMCCANLGEAIEIAKRYSTLVMPLVRVSTQKEGPHTKLEFEFYSRYPDLNQIVMEALIASSKKMLGILTSQNFQIEKLQLSFQQPAYIDHFPKDLARSVEFGSNCNAIYVKHSVFNSEFVTANPTDASKALAECEEELLRIHQSKSMSAKVVELIRFHLEGNPSEVMVADRLNLTERTLRRKLAQEETSFRELLRQVREEMAIVYLRETDLQIAQIALKLGYQETSNFRAAFKTWTGKSPRKWRQEIVE